MSGPYEGAVFSTTKFDVNNCMFPFAFGVLSSENYEDWSWFLQILKKMIGDKEVIIISDGHHALLGSVLEIFGAENHSYCLCINVSCSTHIYM